MQLDAHQCYAALAARDRRFDGVFFTGVTSTGIYCRPVCPSRTPTSRNCRFFASPAAAEAASFRPCLRCRPERAPGLAPTSDAGRVAAWAVEQIRSGTQLSPGSIEPLAARAAQSPRHFRRLVRTTLGVSPMQLVQTTRLLIAKHLLTDTRIPIADIAFASGFGSPRRLQATLQARYGISPSQLRRGHGTPTGSGLMFTLEYREPLDWSKLITFLAGRAIPGVELVDGLTYARTWRAGPKAMPGWFRITPAPGAGRLTFECAETLTPHIAALIAIIRRLFDLDARPDVIASSLAADPILAPSVLASPGLRVPGCTDGFELAWRAVLGQQVSVAAARTLSGRVVASFGEPTTTPIAGLTHITPDTTRMASASPKHFSTLGLTSARAACLAELARRAARGELPTSPPPDPAAAIAVLCECPGIGDWTAQYIAMRALRWPDAFPVGDLILRRKLADSGATTPKAALAHAERWRPWRAYAAMHAWNLLSLEATPTSPATKPRTKPSRTSTRKPRTETP
ncbi:MAG: AlkA N-terminal domain-containing protein [Phycisphaerales bacterium]|jgi:AraC family transcriptional regulator of adaptative response / DNA-3-methyladenine glycosylase II